MVAQHLSKWWAGNGYMGWLPAACAGALLLGLAGCTTSSSYMGIPLVPGAAAEDIQVLAHRAQRGDKQAQLDLGIRFEEGRGVPRDKQRATGLYRMAARDGGGMLWVYSPSPSGGASSRVMQVEGGPKMPGLGEARRRLESSAKEEAKP